MSASWRRLTDSARFGKARSRATRYRPKMRMPPNAGPAPGIRVRRKAATLTTMLKMIWASTYIQ
jgi:hypothetical protein